MNSRELITRTLGHETTDRIPRDLWALPGVVMFRQDELDRFLQAFPTDIIGPEFKYPRGLRENGRVWEVGTNTDAWGSVWHVGEPGVIGEVKEYPIDDWSDLSGYTVPWELIEEADYSRVDASCAATERFVKADTLVRPFERLQFLRGTENVFLDLAYGAPELQALLAMLHEFNLRDIEGWCRTRVDGIQFMDDWGSQTSLLVSPSLWRELFKPLYLEYCQMIHASGKYVFMHSDGDISAIFGDLVEIGVDAVNSQLFCMDMEELGDRYAGRITFWGEIDRQHVLPFGTTDDVRAAVRRACRALHADRGGVIAHCEWGKETPYENMQAVYDEWACYSSRRCS